MANEPYLDDEIIQDYLAECREHLATIETDLMVIEQGGADIDEQLVNRVFRAAHSIKGGAAFLDLNKIRELAHKTENVLDLVRSSQMVPTPEVVSILLLAFDKLRELIQNYLESNQADITEFVDALAALVAEHLPEGQKATVSDVVEVKVPESPTPIRVSAFDMVRHHAGGNTIYLVRYDLIHDIQRRGRRPYEVLKGIGAQGSILETMFDLASAGTLDDEAPNELVLQVVYASKLNALELAEFLGVAAERIQVIDQLGALTPLGTHPPVPAPADPFVPPPVEVLAEPAMEQELELPVAALPAAAPAAPQRQHPAAPAAVENTVQTTVRLNVSLLDSLMTLAGELVLSRNQLNESLARFDERGIRSGAQRVSLVTSELQEVVALTRMQPVGNIFSKFQRLVRDLSRDLGKEVQLRVEGSDVEIDKTILEGLSDPLTHMIRNAVDHGIETPAVRTAAGKPAAGTVVLKASHQAGHVVVEVSDDGKGLDSQKVAASAVAKGAVTRGQVQAMTERERMALVFLPGVSTAEKVSDVSGRGVGMDVVKTNLDRLGGKIEIESTPGNGSSFRIKLPLTLAIIPSLLVSDSGERFAIPQVNVAELIRIPAAQMAQRIDRVGDAEVLILRDRLVPLLYLGDALHGTRADNQRALNIVLVDAGAFEYGLVVEELHDTVEIVVKPLGRHLKTLHDYAGATILGDGRVAVILDVAGLAARAGLSAAKVQAMTRRDAPVPEAQAAGETYSLLLFENAPNEACAVPIELVARIERVRPGQIEYIGSRRTMQYRGSSIPVVALADVAAVGSLSDTQPWVVIIFEQSGRPLGLLGAEPLDMVEARLVLDSVTLRQPGVAGSAVLKDRTTLVVDIFELAGAARPEWYAPPSVAGPAHELQHKADSPRPTVLLAEDSDFFRGQLQKLITAAGYPVLAAEDGQAAWELLDLHALEVAVVATDIEMPRLDGLGLTRRIRADKRFRDLPIIALSSLAGEEEIARGYEAGVNEYQVKLDKDDLLQSINKIAGRLQEMTVLEESI